MPRAYQSAVPPHCPLSLRLLPTFLSFFCILRIYLLIFTASLPQSFTSHSEGGGWECEEADHPPLTVDLSIHPERLSASECLLGAEGGEPHGAISFHRRDAGGRRERRVLTASVDGEC